MVGLCASAWSPLVGVASTAMTEQGVETVRIAHVGRWFAAGVVVLVLLVVGVFAYQGEQDDGQREACDRLAEIQREVGLQVELDDGC